MYCIYLQWSAFRSSTDVACNVDDAPNSSVVWQMVIGIIITMISVFTISASSTADDVVPDHAENEVDNEAEGNVNATAED